MSLAGHRIGPYEIVSALGAGGMGEVYRARDTKLGRDVAIKILPAAFTADPDRRARFEREARVLASLNHPHIGAIYGFEDAGGVHALVLELVEGETLDVRLRGRDSGLGVRDSLAIASQIAQALDAAHERGIVHRDLKPANIAITADGTVKVLDFGLAKSGGASASDGGELSNSPTMAAPTIDGVLLGTAPYMSPEQTRGKAVDKRTDIWAFGCVLYEMLTGRRPFAGETTSDTIAAILEREPDWSVLLAPRAIFRLLRRCLDKDVRRRLRDIGDARFDFEEALAGSASDDGKGRPVPMHRVQFQRLTDFVGMNESPALSPDGKMVAFVAVVGGRRQNWIRLLAGGTPLQITRDDADHENPRWVPDSSALIYFVRSATPGAQGMVREVAALGGVPRPIVPALNAGDVSHDGRRIAVFQFHEGRTDLVAVARDGSGRTDVRPLPTGAGYSYPRWSPDDCWIAFQCERETFDQRLYIMPAGGGEARELARASMLKGTSWLTDGSGLVYSSSAGSTLPYPPTFNLRSVGRDGLDDVPLTFGDLSYVEPDVHHSRKLVACRVRIESDIWRFPVAGTPIENARNASRITRQTGQVQTPSVSPDGREVVYLFDNGGHGNLWVAQTDGSDTRQITFERDPSAFVGVPVWAPAGHHIGFIVNRAGHTSLFVINPDGTDLRQLLPDGGFATAWSGDGEWLYYTPALLGPYSIKRISVRGGAPVAVQSTNAFASAVAPDGSAFYFLMQLKPEIVNWGDWEICVARPEDAPGVPLARIAASRVPVSPGFIHPVISPDGRWLALPLADGATTNLWKLPTEGGPLQPVTDFGERQIVIVRRISWAPDGESLYAAVGETAADVILLDGLLP